MSTKSKRSSKTSIKTNEFYAQVIAKTDCPKCKAKKGHRCISLTSNKAKHQKKGDKRSKPHQIRRSKFTPTKTLKSKSKTSKSKKVAA